MIENLKSCIELYADDSNMVCLAFDSTGIPYGFFKHNDFDQVGDWKHLSSGKFAREVLKELKWPKN